MVLDWVDGTLGDPVDRILKVGGVEDGSLLIREVSWSLVSEESLVLKIGPGSELVVTNSEGILGGVDLSDLGGLLGEDGSSEFVLLLGSVGESESRDVLHESLFDFSRDWGFALVEAKHGTGRANEVHIKVVFDLLNYKYLKIAPF